MAYNSDSNLRFRPYRVGDFRANRPIQQGGQDTTPWKKGIQDLAFNQLTLWSQTAPSVIQDAKHSSITVTAATTDYDFALYRWSIPGCLNGGSGSGRRYLQVTVVGKVAAGTFTIKGRTSSGTTVASAASVGAGYNTLIFNVNCPQTGEGDYLILSIQTSSGPNQVVFLAGVTARIMPMATDVLGEGTAISNNSFKPVDSTSQGSEGYPLTIKMTQDLIDANQNLYQKNVRGVISTCLWGIYGTLPVGVTAPNNGFFLEFLGALDAPRGHQWVYFPRPGVSQLRVYCDGYVTGWAAAGDNATLSFGFDGQTPISWTLAKANALGAVSGWPCDGTLIDVPANKGPLYLNLLRMDTANTKAVNIMSFSVMEVVR
jgi:hypothetical protein